MHAIGDGPALGAKRRNSMTSLAKVGTVEKAGLVAAEDVAEPAKADGMSIREQEEDEPEGDRVSEEVEQLVLDIKSDKVKTKVYTLEEHTRLLDSIRDGRSSCGNLG